MSGSFRKKCVQLAQKNLLRDKKCFGYLNLIWWKEKCLQKEDKEQKKIIDSF